MAPSPQLPGMAPATTGLAYPSTPLTGDVNGTVGEERPPPGSGKSGGALAGSLSGGALETSWVGHVLSMGGWLPLKVACVGSKPVVHKEGSHCLALQTRVPGPLASLKPGQ